MISPLSETIARLRAQTTRSQQDQWRMSAEPYTIADLQGGQWQQWAIAPLNDREHVAWARGRRELWLCQDIAVPSALAEFPLSGLYLRLALRWWAELAEIYVEGQLVQVGDLFDCFTRIRLSDRVTPGDRFWVALHLVSPGHDDGALVQSAVVYESAEPEAPEPGFVADELAVLHTYLDRLAPHRVAELEAAVAALDWEQVGDRRAFQSALTTLRQRLQPLSPWIKHRRIDCVGHAHLDLAWLWPVAETWEAAERTFRSVLALQTAFPELTYTHSSPALFAWLETHQPELFQQIQAAVAAGTWAIDGGLWVEPETQTLSGESLARQLLYGQRYTRSRFGQESAIAWLPDTFGFSWQLPQLLTLAGIQCFATQKLRWNETTQFPYHLFWWEGLDGTRLLSLTLPPIGTDVDPLKMASHAADWEAQTGISTALWLPGMGDHGGGPTRDMMEKARRWARSPFFPRLQFTSIAQHLAAIAPTPMTPPAPPAKPLPTWRDELYLELHRGCYTVHADQKWFNRRCEETLREAEIFAAIAHRQGIAPYPQPTLETAWKQVLFNQFHDILPGTSIPEVFATVNADWQAAYETAKRLRHEAIAAIAPTLPLPTPPHPQALPVVVFNSLNWERTDWVALDWEPLAAIAPAWRVIDPETGADLPTQLSPYTDDFDTPPGQVPEKVAPAVQFRFLAIAPSLGYRVYWLVPEAGGSLQQPDFTGHGVGEQGSATLPEAADVRLENEHLWAIVDGKTGEIQALGTQGQASVVRSPANALQLFRDAGQYWDAWEIAPNYEQHPLAPARLLEITWLERGPWRQRLRVVRQVGEASTVQQDYVLDAQVPYLKVVTLADWQETQVVLKAAFPLTVTAAKATYEIPFGAIARPTQSDDPHQQAKWEVPGVRWADLSDGDRGVSLLTDYKHGFDAKPNQLRLTLLKAPLWPDPTADRGRHAFTYALYPHAGDWRTAQTPHQASAFNTPLRVWVGSPAVTSSPQAPTQCTWLALGSDRVHLSALKRAEDSNDLILRCWDPYGEGATLSLSPQWERVNLLEEPMVCDSPHTLLPWAIATLKAPTPTIAPTSAGSP